MMVTKAAVLRCNGPPLALQASKAGLRIYRPGLKMEEEQSQGWFGWMWNWSGDGSAQTKEVKPGGTEH